MLPLFLSNGFGNMLISRLSKSGALLSDLSDFYDSPDSFTIDISVAYCLGDMFCTVVASN